MTIVFEMFSKPDQVVLLLVKLPEFFKHGHLFSTSPGHILPYNLDGHPLLCA